MKKLTDFIDSLKNVGEIEWGGGKQPDGTITFPFPL